MGNLLKWGIIGAVGIFVIIMIGNCISANNEEVGTRNQFTATDSERFAFFDGLWKKISQVGQVALRNDSSFRQNVTSIMEGRKDGQNIMMKWITESNPNANFGEVSALYANLSRLIESERTGLFQIEKRMADIKLQHDNIIDKFPGSILFWILGRKKIDYKPISSGRTDDVRKTGQDNDVKVF